MKLAMSEREDLKEKILRIATSEFGAHGYSRVTTTNLASAIGISKRTLYEYFSSKEELFREIVERKLDSQKNLMLDIKEKILNDPECDFIAEMQKMWTSIQKENSEYSHDLLEDVRRHLPEVWDRIQEYREQHMRKYLKKIHEIGRERGFYKKGQNLELLYWLFFNIMADVFRSDITNELPMTKIQIINEISNILFTGILTDEGRREFESNNLKEITK